MRCSRNTARAARMPGNLHSPSRPSERLPAPGRCASLLGMKVTLTKALVALVKEKVRSGRYVDESDVVRDAWRWLEERGEYESPALETALLEGVRSRHRAYGPTALDRVRKAARKL